MALLLSSGEWGEWGVLASSVALHPPMGSTPHDLLLARVSLLPPRLSIISFTSPVRFPRRFPRLSLAVTIIIHFLGGFSMLLHLLCTILMRLHLWHLRLRSLLCCCVLCLTRIGLLLRHRTLPFLSRLHTTLRWRLHRPLLHLLLASRLLPWLLLRLLPRLLLLLSWSSLPLQFLFGLLSLSSYLSSRMPRLIWMCTTWSCFIFVDPSTVHPAFR